jgi:tetratricopeptide (TPR) repeat protein
MVDLNKLWDFGDPAGSEQRFRALAATADVPDSAILTTQIARALGLQDRFDEGHAVLDAIPDATGELAVRVALERGRLLRSSDDPLAALPHFENAVAEAAHAGLDGLQVDALHMLALVVPPEEQVAVHQRALELARTSPDADAQKWVPSLLNNLGMTYSDLGDWDAALAIFEEALVDREKGDDAEATRIAKWMVAWTLRNLGRRDEALAIQVALKRELDEVGATDTHVDEEMALLEGMA